MRLNDFLNQAGASVPAPVKPVRFKVVGYRDRDRTVTEVSAVLVYISEKERQEALKNAQSEMRKQYPDSPTPPDRLQDEQNYQVLFAALRDADQPDVMFAPSPAELRAAITQSTANELVDTFQTFMEEQFPPWISAEDFASLVEEAKSKSLAALLSSSGFWKIRRALLSLAIHFGKSQTSI